MSDAWTKLANDYARHRLGYSPEVYDTILQFGLRRGATILDVGCGTGIASAPFVANGFEVTGVDASESMLEQARMQFPSATFVKGNAEALPFPDERFGGVISAQVFHWLDRARALREAHRVLSPGGVIAIWWKHLSAQEPVRAQRDEVFRAMGEEPLNSGLPGGFKEFYASSFSNQTLRVIPWRTAVSLEQYMGYERSRCNLRTALGDRAGTYFNNLQERLHQEYGPGNPSLTLSYVHYLYLALKS